MYNPREYVDLIYVDRMRTRSDKDKVMELYDALSAQASPELSLSCQITSETLQIGHSFLLRESASDFSRNGSSGCTQGHLVLHRTLRPMESLMKCIQMNWMAILVSSMYYDWPTLGMVAYMALDCRLGQLGLERPA